MVKVTFDTKKDPLHELEEMLKLLQDAIAHRKKPVASEDELAAYTQELAAAQEEHKEEEPVAAPEQSEEEPLKEEKVLETPLFSITVPSEEPQDPAVKEAHKESITDEELTDMFEKTGEKIEKPKKKTSIDSDGYIEIVDMDDENA